MSLSAGAFHSTGFLELVDLPLRERRAVAPGGVVHLCVRRFGGCVLGAVSGYLLRHHSMAPGQVRLHNSIVVRVALRTPGSTLTLPPWKGEGEAVSASGR